MIRDITEDYEKFIINWVHNAKIESINNSCFACLIQIERAVYVVCDKFSNIEEFHKKNTGYNLTLIAEFNRGEFISGDKKYNLEINK